MDIKQTKKRIAVISGGTGYVGFEVAKKLSNDGMIIAMLYYNTTKDEVSNKLSVLEGKGHRAYSCNLADEDAIKKTVDMIEEEMGDIYACIHTAGVMPKPKQLYLSTSKDLREQFDVNVFGSFNFLSACALKLKDHKKGIIIGITTAGVVTRTNTKARGAYSSIKFALQGMLVALKEELSPYNIRVYSVAPGFMEGGMNSSMPKAFVEIVKNSSPTKMITNASEVAEKISFLCSDNSVNIKELTFLIAPETQI